MIGYHFTSNTKTSYDITFDLELEALKAEVSGWQKEA